MSLGSFPDPDFEVPVGALRTDDYLETIGVPSVRPASSPFDPGYDPLTFEGHLMQSAHLMEAMKVSMACWQICNEAVTRWKVAACTHYGVATVTGGGPFEVAVHQGQLPLYLDLAADIGVSQGRGWRRLHGHAPGPAPGDQHGRGAGPRRFSSNSARSTKGRSPPTSLVALSTRGGSGSMLGLSTWLSRRARAPGVSVALMTQGQFNAETADRFVSAFGLERCLFEAPTKPSQFALINHFGREVHLCNIRLEELLRVEIYRRGLHSDAFEHENLRPRPAEVAHGSRWRVSRTVVIDCFPSSVDRYVADHAIVAIDVIRASTLVVTAVAGGRRCLLASDVRDALALRESYRRRDPRGRAARGDARLLRHEQQPGRAPTSRGRASTGHHASRHPVPN